MCHELIVPKEDAITLLTKTFFTLLVDEHFKVSKIISQKSEPFVRQIQEKVDKNDLKIYDSEDY